MYGVVEMGGHQYRVEPGEILDIQKIETKEGETLEMDKVLFIGGEKPLLGKPVVEGAKVLAKVIRHDRSRKQIVLKRKPGLYKKKNGHRQHFTSLLITDIEDGQGGKAQIDKKSKNAEKYL